MYVVSVQIKLLTKLNVKKIKILPFANIPYNNLPFTITHQKTIRQSQGYGLIYSNIHMSLYI